MTVTPVNDEPVIKPIAPQVSSDSSKVTFDVSKFTSDVDGDKLTISQAGSTMMACDPPEAMQQEMDFLAALQSAATYAIDGDQLTIANEAGETVLTFKASVPATLVGTNWVATMYNTGTEAVTNVMEGTTCLLYTSPSPRDRTRSRMPSSA